MEKEINDRQDVEALCRECGHAFKVYIDRVTSKSSSELTPTRNPPIECPVCGCGDCRIGR